MQFLYSCAALDKVAIDRGTAIAELLVIQCSKVIFIDLLN